MESVNSSAIIADIMKQKEKILGEHIIDDLIMILLSIISVLLLVFEFISDQSQSQQRILDYIDIGIACVFLVEFFYRFFKTDKKRNFLRTSWWELLSAIPITNDLTQGLRTLRILRIIRLIRILRLIRLTVRLRIILSASQKFAKHTYLIYVLTTVATILMAGTLSFYYFEFGVNPNVHSLWDSFWYVVVTSATVGYGDIYPVTVGGRIVGIFLMVFGIGALSLLIAAFASVFVKNKKK